MSSFPPKAMSGSAERTRRWRARANDGRLVVPVELDVDDTEVLFELRVLDHRDTDNRAALAEAVKRMFRTLRNL